MDFIREFVLETLNGQALLELFDTYFQNQSELNQVFMLIGAGVLIVLGLLSLVKMTLKLTSSILKVIIILAILYYVLAIFLDLF